MLCNEVYCFIYDDENMKNKILLLSIALIASITLIAQKQEIIYYDKSWKGCSPSEAEFYRIVNYDENGIPVGRVIDYFITGELQANIDSALYIDKIDDSKSKFIGFTEGFYKSGTKQFEAIYDNQGNIVTRKKWYENGLFHEYQEYENGQRNEKTKVWYENGQLHKEIDYKNGIFDGQLLIYWENGNAKRVDEYKNGELVTGKCFNIDGEEIVYFDYLVLPEFPGGEKLYQYISNEIRYPRNSRRNGIEGTVIIGFAVDIDGSISDIKIHQMVNDDIDKESIRVVEKMSKWIPGKVDGEITKLYLNIPISFRLR